MNGKAVDTPGAPGSIVQRTIQGREVAHLYQADRGARGWEGERYTLEGYDPAVSVYDVNFGDSDTPFHVQVANGIRRVFGRLPLSAPTMTRNGRVAAQHNTLPAARFFNQLGHAAGTGQSWSPAAVAQGQRALRLGWNPNMQGAAEAHPATTYNPYPAPGALYPKVV